MSNYLNEIVKNVLPEGLTETAMEAALSAIVKLISDGFVRKELYKEKLAELETQNNELIAAREELSTAVKKIETFEEVERERKISVMVENQKKVALERLEASGANPQFIKLLMKELDFDAFEFGNTELEPNSDILSQQIKVMQESYPYAFGELETQRAPVAKTPACMDEVRNPWGKENRNLEEQIKIYRANPNTAREMALSAGIRL